MHVPASYVLGVLDKSENLTEARSRIISYIETYLEMGYPSSDSDA